MKLRLATLHDADLLLAWRNDVATRAFSHSTQEVSPEEHLAWLTQSLSSPSRAIYIAEQQGESVGSIRADRGLDGTTTLSWMVAPLARGQGLGKRMLVTMLAEISGPVCAEIKSSNAASVRMAQAAGLALLREEAGVLYYGRS